MVPEKKAGFDEKGEYIMSGLGELVPKETAAQALNILTSIDKNTNNISPLMLGIYKHIYEGISKKLADKEGNLNHEEARMQLASFMILKSVNPTIADSATKLGSTPQERFNYSGNSSALTKTLQQIANYDRRLPPGENNAKDQLFAIPGEGGVTLNTHVDNAVPVLQGILDKVISQFPK